MDYDRVRRTLMLVLLLNIIVAIAKAVFGLASGSVSMVADALHSSFDSLSNIVGITAISIAKMPPDATHPYGHGRFETIGTMVIGALLMISAYWIVIEGAGRLYSGVSPHITPLTVGVLCITIVINIGVTWYERRVGRQEKSQILIADATHTFSDVFISLSVLGGFAVVAAGFPQADPLIAFVIGGLIAKMGIGILRDAGQVLADANVIECEEDVARILSQIRGVKGYHKFRCRGKPEELFADVHIIIDGSITVSEGHSIADEVRDRLCDGVKGMRDVVVHIDPEDGTGKNLF